MMSCLRNCFGSNKPAQKLISKKKTGFGSFQRYFLESNKYKKRLRISIFFFECNFYFNVFWNPDLDFIVWFVREVDIPQLEI